jgi:hypothetical protein
MACACDAIASDVNSHFIMILDDQNYQQSVINGIK